MINNRKGINMKIRLRLLFLIEDIKYFLLFIKYLPGYFKLHYTYGYSPDTYNFIIDNYEQVLCNRTKLLSKPTYCWRTVINELDRYYEEVYKGDK